MLSSSSDDLVRSEKLSHQEEGSTKMHLLRKTTPLPSLDGCCWLVLGSNQGPMFGEDERCCLPCEDVGSFISILKSERGRSMLKRRKAQRRLR